MGTKSASLRRPFAVVAAAIAICVVAFGLIGSPATGKPHKPKCPKGNEKPGCKFPVNASWRATTKTGSTGSTVGLIEVTAQRSRIGASFQSVYIDCTTHTQANGDKTGLAANYHLDKTVAKVGKTYTINDTESRPATEEGPASSAISTVTVNFKTAKQVVISLHFISTLDGVVQCDGKLPPTTLKRDPGT